MKKFRQFVNEDLPTKEVDPNKFPNPGEKNDKEFFLRGKKDGNLTDDVVKTKDAAIPAKSLKPSQDAIYLGKALGLAIGGVKGGDLGAVISLDNRILDGHHRWAATMFADPNAKIKGKKADLAIGDLVPVLRQAGDAMGNERGLPPKSGDVNIFDATMDHVKAAIYKGENMDPQFYDKEKSIKWFESVGEENIAKRLKAIQSVPPPVGAPPRAEMPKIEPHQVDKVAKSLSGGRIDVRTPYNENKETNMWNLPTYEQFIGESADQLRFRYVITKDWKHHGMVDRVKGDTLFIEINSDGDVIPAKSKDVYVLYGDQADEFINAAVKYGLEDGDDIKAFVKKYVKGGLAAVKDWVGESVKEMFGQDEPTTYTLANGSVVQAYVDSIKGMAGESVSILRFADDKGKDLDIKKVLSMLSKADKKEVEQWMKDLEDENAAMAKSHVK